MTKIQLFDDQGEGLDFTPGGQMPATTGTVNATTSLNAVAANGNGTVVDFGSAKRCVSLLISTTGAPTAGTVTLSVSLDGVTYVASATTAAVTANPAVAFLANVAVRYARADLSALAGGTAPTVTAKLMAS